MLMKGWKGWRQRIERSWLEAEEKRKRNQDGEGAFPWDACPRFGKWTQDQRYSNAGLGT